MVRLRVLVNSSILVLRWQAMVSVWWQSFLLATVKRMLDVVCLPCASTSTVWPECMCLCAYLGVLCQGSRWGMGAGWYCACFCALCVVDV